MVASYSISLYSAVCRYLGTTNCWKVNPKVCRLYQIRWSEGCHKFVRYPYDVNLNNQLFSQTHSWVKTMYLLRYDWLWRGGSSTAEPQPAGGRMQDSSLRHWCWLLHVHSWHVGGVVAGGEVVRPQRQVRGHTFSHCQADLYATYTILNIYYV